MSECTQRGSGRLSLAAAVACLACFMLAGEAAAQNSAPSSHMVFDDNFPGDIIINQVRVPQAGEAMYTYYEALGWRGKGAGYAGIQVHPRGHNFIFSIWDHKAHRGPIRAVHRGPQTLTEKFGGEGTGLKSWNFGLGWKTDVWYTLVARTWQVERDEQRFSHFGFWARAGDTQKWTHLVTMEVAAADAVFEGRTDAFIEDWLNTGAKRRVTQLRGGWKRRSEDGAWHPFQSARYSVNAWDLVEGKRSFHFRTQWDGGVEGAGQDGYYFMVAGGKETMPRVKNPSQHSLPRKEKQPNFAPAKIRDLKATNQNGVVRITWDVDPQTSPPFSTSWQVLPAEGDQPLAKGQESSPHARTIEAIEAIEAIETKAPAGARVRLTVTDIFGQVSKPVTVAIQRKQANESNASK